MRVLSGQEHTDAFGYIIHAAESAQKALCLNAHCGAVVIHGGTIVGRGYNGPPRDDLSKRYCKNTIRPQKKNYDKTCCVHAEWRAIVDALRHIKNLSGSRLYFVRVDDKGDIKKSGKPYCTVCSRLALDAGISEFILWHEEGICVYNTEEYNDMSYCYGTQYNGVL